ncbi:hypothetical protein Bint_0338 [Brachyspira intermedia PWS/A]|uniref:Uncharacterized protein n=1 Tax=Brachyspira intermedia (strain ATCC 51140 / PWS/A) TaxID=1045858 RepID=G0EIG4_BRAIP|nr:hypothetical protein [Brachyspira intermedia]AEM20972.1 hypothetical protein Bint_0338 [Brachyspira intermedia PWS/A]
MKKVSKKVKFLAVLLGSLLISTSAFAVELTIDNSAVKRATAGQFSTDSDKVNAKDIFDLQRSFFSAGYLGQASGAISGDGNGTATAKGINNGVQGSFGVALPAGMYLGIGAAYNLNDSANYETRKDTISGTKWQINSTANFIAALRINDMAAVHYNFILYGFTGTPFIYNENHTKNPNEDYKTYNNYGSWRHEIEAAIKFGEHKLTIPVSVTFNAMNTKEKGSKYLNTGTANSKINVDNVNYVEGDGIWLGLEPEFFLSLPAGPMTGINMGLNLEAKLTHNVGKNGVFADQNQSGTGTPTYTKNEYKTTQKAAVVDLGVWASFPMEWSLANDQVSLAMEPQINLEFVINNTDKMEQSVNGGAATVINNIYGSDYLSIMPVIELPIGTLWRPVEWYELRFGTALLLGADITISQAKDANGKANKTTSYQTMSGIAGFFGMGFIVTDDFNLDLYAEAQQLNFFTMGFGGQLTYRFN